MALACKHLERCNWCQPRSARVPCWWITTETGPWRLCAACLAYAEDLS